MPVPRERDAVQRHLLRETAYETLCEAIISGTLAPGETLHDNELCSWLGLSRTPVRGALVRLAEEGLVECAPQRFTRVTPVEVRDARSLFPVLATVHALATELAVPLLGPGDHHRLRAENDRHRAALAAGDASAAYTADARFHGVLVEVSANADVERVLARLAPRLRRLELLPSVTLPGSRALAQHEAIIARAAAGDDGSAASAAREHWLSFGGLVERSLAG
jgi:DNA-binding GntR family transcriptional regulator